MKATPLALVLLFALTLACSCTKDASPTPEYAMNWAIQNGGVYTTKTTESRMLGTSIEVSGTLTASSGSSSVLLHIPAVAVGEYVFDPRSSVFATYTTNFNGIERVFWGGGDAASGTVIRGGKVSITEVTPTSVSGTFGFKGVDFRTAYPTGPAYDTDRYLEGTFCVRR
jgi:hypothetical protein